MTLDERLLLLNRDSIGILREAWQAGRLTIFVGAGASAEAGLPTWSGVLDEMLVSFVRTLHSHDLSRFFEDEIRDGLRAELQHQSPIVLAHYLQARLSKEEYLNLVHGALYGRLPSRPMPGAICRAVARLAARLKSVVTFNYDDLIEDALRIEGHRNTSVWGAGDWGDVVGVPVYHPHGFLPYSREPLKDYWVVLAEADYHTQYAQPFTWSNVAVSKALLESTCLFVSTSVTDPNLRRLLDFMHRETPNRYHYFMWSRPEPDALKGVEAVVYEAYQDVFLDSHARLGLKPLWFFYRDDPAAKWADIPALLDSIREL